MSKKDDKELAFKKILVPVDGSENSSKAADVAIGLAASYGARITLFHAIVTPAAVLTADSMAPYGNLSEYWSQARKEAVAFTDAISEKARKGRVEVEVKIVDNISSAVQAIVGEAENRDVDLIVMGTRGMGGFRRMLLGSVSNGVLGHAHCSVLVVR